MVPAHVTAVEFHGNTLRFLEALPTTAPEQGFVWIFLGREQLPDTLPWLQQAASRLGGSPMLDLHCQDLATEEHPSRYDYTSVYDLIVFRRLPFASELAVQGQLPSHGTADPLVWGQLHSLAVGFVVYDRLLISVHPDGCQSARQFVQRFLADVQLGVDVSTARNRMPLNPSDLVLRMINQMVDSYLDLRKQLADRLERWQQQLLQTNAGFANWNALMAARNQLHALEDLCEEQHDAMQEWLDSLAEHLPAAQAGLSGKELTAHHDLLIARGRDVIEHIQRVLHHVRRLEQSAETAVQIHFSAQGNRTNDIMRVLTTLTAIFLPLNLIAGIFGMNFLEMPLLKLSIGFWIAIGSMLSIAVLLSLWFWRKHYLRSDD